jgi:hypothetical protein
MIDKKKKGDAPLAPLQISDSIWPPHIMPSASHTAHPSCAKSFDAFLVRQKHRLEAGAAGDLFLRYMRAQELRVLCVIDEVSVSITDDWILCRS